MSLGVVIPQVHGRGAGLGNEMIVWAKAYIAAEVLGLVCLPPAFGLNSRGYSRYFRTPRFDWALHAGLRTALPHFTLSEADHVAAGSRSLTTTVEEFAARNRLSQRSIYTLSVEGMWGGFHAIEPARDFILSQLLDTRWTLGNMFATRRKLASGRLTVGFHIRRGDFSASAGNDEYRGRFNVALPLDWYVNIARNLRAALGKDINLIVVSDAPSDELAPFGSEIDCCFTDDQANRDVSDLLSLSACDLVVCSISSYSLWAAFLSSGRYIWPQANLTTNGGLSSIWGHEAEQARPGSPTAEAVMLVQTQPPRGALGKGVPVDWDGELPDALIGELVARSQMLRRETDLLRYGVVNT